MAALPFLDVPFLDVPFLVAQLQLEELELEVEELELPERADLEAWVELPFRGGWRTRLLSHRQQKR
jgi:hypothetical protein